MEEGVIRLEPFFITFAKVLLNQLVTTDQVVLLLGTNDIPLLSLVNVVYVLIPCAQALVARKKSLEVIICGIIPQIKSDSLYQVAIMAANQ